MADSAIRSFSQRKVEVKRVDLLDILQKNKTKHVAEYNEAMGGYKEALTKKLEKVYAEMKESVEKTYREANKRLGKMTEQDITKGRMVFSFGGTTVSLPVPTSFEKEYDAAIDMVKWDVRETLELTMSEFNCFVRDEWDWSSSFSEVTSNYKRS